MGFVSNGVISNFLNSGSAKDSGKVSTQEILKKGPFDILKRPYKKLRENPLSFNHMQYPLDLGSNELGHYILFESGFVGYSPKEVGFQQNIQQALLIRMHNVKNKGKSFTERQKITAKVTLGFLLLHLV